MSFLIDVILVVLTLLALKQSLNFVSMLEFEDKNKLLLASLVGATMFAVFAILQKSLI